MKTSVSIPDHLFQAADRHARLTHQSRSQLDTVALAEYLARHEPDQATSAINEVVGQLGETKDPFVVAAARRVLEQTEW